MNWPRVRSVESEVGILLGLIDSGKRVHVWQGDIAAAQPGSEDWLMDIMRVVLALSAILASEQCQVILSAFSSTPENTGVRTSHPQQNVSLR